MARRPSACGEVVEGEIALALGRPAVADRQQAGEPLVGFEVGGIGEQRIAVARLETGADQQLELLFAAGPDTPRSIP